MIKDKHWNWTGHVNRMKATAIPKNAKRWTPAEKRKKGRTKETLRRSMEKKVTVC